MLADMNMHNPGMYAENVVRIQQLISDIAANAEQFREFARNGMFQFVQDPLMQVTASVQQFGFIVVPSPNRQEPMVPIGPGGLLEQPGAEPWPGIGDAFSEVLRAIGESPAGRNVIGGGNNWQWIEETVERIFGRDTAESAAGAASGTKVAAPPAEILVDAWEFGVPPAPPQAPGATGGSTPASPPPPGDGRWQSNNSIDLRNVDPNNLPPGWTKSTHNGHTHIRDPQGRLRIRIDPPDGRTNFPHKHFMDQSGNSLDINGNIVSPNSPAAHIRIP
jgi:hypothetical protein